MARNNYRFLLVTAGRSYASFLAASVILGIFCETVTPGLLRVLEQDQWVKKVSRIHLIDFIDFIYFIFRTFCLTYKRCQSSGIRIQSAHIALPPPVNAGELVNMFVRFFAWILPRKPQPACQPCRIKIGPLSILYKAKLIQ